jgi:hypothetical protein
MQSLEFWVSELVAVEGGIPAAAAVVGCIAPAATMLKALASNSFSSVDLAR